MDRTKREDVALLGMSLGRARHRLVTALLFDMASRLGELNCYRCGHRIEEPDDFSIDHKVPWRKRDTAELYWDMTNLAFSHKRCNTPDRRYSRPAPPGQGWCSKHQEFLPAEQFSSNARTRSGLANWCRWCESEKAQRYAKQNPRHPCPVCRAPMRKVCGSCGHRLEQREYMALRRSEGAAY